MPIDPNDRDAWLKLIDDPKKFSAEKALLPEGTRINLAGVDLSGRDLKYAVLSGCDLTGANLRGSRVSAYMLKSCRLKDVDISTIVFEESPSLGGAMEILRLLHLLWSDVEAFNRARPTPLVFSSVDISGADLRKANLSDSSFNVSNLSGVDLSGLTITDFDLSSCKLDGANFSGAKIGRMKAEHCSIDGANFTDAQLSAVFFAKTDFNRALMERASITRCTLNGSCRSGNFADAVISKTTFSRGKMDGASFARSKQTEVGFLECDLSGADFKGASAEDVKFDKCDTTDADFKGATGFPRRRSVRKS